MISHDYPHHKMGVCIGMAIFISIVVISSVYSQDQNGPNEELINAISSSDLSKVTELINQGVDVNAGFESGYTALMQALYMSNVEIIKILLKNEANPDVGGGEYPAINFPCMLAQFDTVKMLIEAGANPNIRDDKGGTPLKYVKDYYAKGVEYLTLNQNNVKEATNGNLKLVSQKVVAWNNIIKLLVSVGGTE